METHGHFREMRIVGGNVALDFVNTRSGPPLDEPDLEALNDYGDLVAWGRHVGLLTDVESDRLLRRAARRRPAARQTFDRAIRVRATLDQLFRAVSRGGPPPARALAELASAEADALERGTLIAVDDGFEWRWRDDDLGRPLWPVIHAGVELLTAGRLDRVKGCGGCRFLFVDETKNGSRRWCSMDDCGTAQKARNYVTRRAERRRAERSSSVPPSSVPRGD
jgi:predicted RNA-binding Zn ribbon-like protein